MQLSITSFKGYFLLIGIILSRFLLSAECKDSARYVPTESENSLILSGMPIVLNVIDFFPKANPVGSNNTLINWGFFFESVIMDTGALILEVDYDKNIVLELAYSPIYYTYRARKSDWDFTVNLIRGDSNLDNIINIVDILIIISITLEN